VYVLATIRVIYESLHDKRITQQENSATKLVDIFVEDPVTAMLGRVN
jgi:hypothetical protein